MSCFVFSSANKWNVVENVEHAFILKSYFKSSNLSPGIVVYTRLPYLGSVYRLGSCISNVWAAPVYRLPLDFCRHLLCHVPGRKHKPRLQADKWTSALSPSTAGEVGYLFHRSSSSSTYSYPASPSSFADTEPELRQTQMARYFIQLRVFDGGRMRINGQRAHWSVYTFIALK